MRTYRHVGVVIADESNEARLACRCPDCGALVDVSSNYLTKETIEALAVHDAYHAKVDGMFRALDHLMDGSVRRER